jgi:hypothetical protein
MFDKMFISREEALAWEWTEYGVFHEEVTPLIVIKTIEHKEWQTPGFP